ncbi:hypothetical protein [Pseudomonas asplenii]|uniref:hypothetical protein n=1 Tax=Pseudomonas asplenii TaxID=53407 RepID=UPI000373DBE9|nr:hypothetical protein [Pseudomonas fuscovaginae]
MKMETALYKALVASNVSEQHATAVIDALENDMTSTLATKADVTELRAELKGDITKLQVSLIKLEAKVDGLGTMLTLRLFMMLAGTVTTVLAGMKYML